jgi:tRNA A-37 threonylcarbamoyl transferase component Bud32
MTTASAATVATGSQARRAERLEAARSLLDGPPPLQALGPGRVVVLEGSVVHASRSRPVVRWAVTVDSGSGPVPLAVIGKGYRKGGGEEAGRLLAQLRRAGFDHPPLQVPEPYGFDPIRQVVAQEEAPPTTLRSLLYDDPAAAVPAVELVGRWLARLHAAAGVEVPLLADDFEQRKLTEYATALTASLPKAAHRLAALTARTLAALPRGAAHRVVTHGDFQPGNIHLDEDRVVVIDFDRAASAPAARDLGHFLGQALTMGAARHGSLAAAAPWVGAFLRGYTAGGGDQAAVAAAPVYLARTFAEVLFYRLVVRPVPDWTFVPTWLDAWEGALEMSPVVGHR